MVWLTVIVIVLVILTVFVTLRVQEQSQRGKPLAQLSPEKPQVQSQYGKSQAQLLAGEPQAQLLNAEPQTCPYEKKEALFTPAEHAFLSALEQAAGSQYRITSKVRRLDIIRVRKELSPSEQASARNRINQKHVDFVLCDPRTLKIVGVIELDDRSHERPDRQNRDEFVDAALAASGVPILHVKAQRSYSVPDLQEQIKEALARTAALGGTLARTAD